LFLKKLKRDKNPQKASLYSVICKGLISKNERLQKWLRINKRDRKCLFVRIAAPQLTTGLLFALFVMQKYL